MGLERFLKRICLRFFSDQTPLPQRNIHNDEIYLDKLYERNYRELRKHNNYVIRSFLQYKCQMYQLSPTKITILSLVSPFIMIAFVPCVLLYTCCLKTRNRDEKVAIVNGDVDYKLIPTSLQKKYQPVKCCNNRFALDRKGLIWIAKVSGKYLLHPYFVLKLTMKVAQYSYLILKYHPEIIITTSEYSFCSSALTGFCEQLGIKHINVMHGEKCFNIRDSFFRFTNCYVWEDYYVKLFMALKANIDQFVVERPPKHLELIDLGKVKIPLRNMIKFYWASEYDKEELTFISGHLHRLAELGFKVIVRYHPLHKSAFYDRVYSFFEGFEVEDPIQVLLCDSLLETEYVLGTYTTALYEGYLMNRKTIINDFNYSSLRELRSLSINLPHIRLSEF